MLLQLCLEIRPPNPPPPPPPPNSQVIKMAIRSPLPPWPKKKKKKKKKKRRRKLRPRRYIGGLMPSTTAIKGCYSSCAWRSDPLSPPPETKARKTRDKLREIQGRIQNLDCQTGHKWPMKPKASLRRVAPKGGGWGGDHPSRRCVSRSLPRIILRTLHQNGAFWGKKKREMRLTICAYKLIINFLQHFKKFTSKWFILSAFWRIN